MNSVETQICVFVCVFGSQSSESRLSQKCQHVPTPPLLQLQLPKRLQTPKPTSNKSEPPGDSDVVTAVFRVYDCWLHVTCCDLLCGTWSSGSDVTEQLPLVEELQPVKWGELRDVGFAHLSVLLQSALQSLCICFSFPEGVKLLLTLFQPPD